MAQYSITSSDMTAMSIEYGFGPFSLGAVPGGSDSCVAASPVAARSAASRAFVALSERISACALSALSCGLRASAAALYVATTPRDQPLERLAIPGLGFRARGGVSVTPQGVLLELAGSPALFIPADAVELITDATWAIDRAVEPGGLLLLGWRLAATDQTAAPTSVDSYFRFSDPADRTAISAAIKSFAVGAPGTTNGSTASSSTEFGTEESEV